jgi:hypothetical protein
MTITIVKYVALAAVMAIAAAVPVAAAAQTPSSPRATRIANGNHPVRRAMNHFGHRIRRGVETGRITTAERARLQAAITAFRGRLQTLRQDGVSQAERLRVRQGLRRVSRAIARANRGGANR